MRACALLCLAAAAAAAQDNPPPAAQPAPPVLRITVTLVQVDAVVTDSHGKRVTGLSAGDFELLQDGVPQKVSYFSYIPEPEPLPAQPRNVEKTPQLAPQPITAGQVRRTVALVVDDLALSFPSLVRVREALRQYVEEQMQPGDLVAVVRTGGGVALLEQFTTDKRLLLEAIDLLKWRYLGRGLPQIRPLSGHGGAEGPIPAPFDSGYTLSALGSLGTLEQVVHGMGQLPGRKSVVLLSDSLQADSEIAAAIQRLTDLANRSNVSIYTIDPRGLQSGMSAAEVAAVEDRPGRARPTAPNRGAEEADDPFAFPLPPGAMAIESASGLSDLAQRTGGMFYANRNDIAGCVREATADQLGYYLLGYTPRQGTFDRDRDREKAKFHRVAVRVLRPGVRVRWKSGFTGVPDELTLTGYSVKTPEQQMLEALSSPFAATEIKVQLTSLFSVAKKTGPFVQSMLHFDAGALTFTHDADGMWHSTVDIVATSYRGLKRTAFQRQRVQPIAIPDEMYRKVLRDGILYTFDDPMAEPGTFLVRVVVRDHASGRIGSASQFLAVPDTRKGQLAVSSVVLRLATPELQRALGLKVPETRDGVVEAWTEGGPATRRYHPGQVIVYGYIVINPRPAGPGKAPKASTQLRLYRNGQPFFTGPVQQALQRFQENPADFMGAGLLRLGDSLAPGEYLLQLTVTDPLANKKRSQVSQWMDFEVVEGSPHGG